MDRNESNLPQIMFPHIHSTIGLPSLSQTGLLVYHIHKGNPLINRNSSGNPRAS